MQYVGLEMVSACLFVLASLYASKKRFDTFSGSIIVGGAAFVSIAGTHNFTFNALNPAVTLALNFMNKNFADTPQVLVSTFLGALVALLFYMILEIYNPEQPIVTKKFDEDTQSQKLMSEKQGSQKSLIKEEKNSVHQIQRED